MTYLAKTVGFYSNYPREKTENLKFNNIYAANDQVSFQKGNLKSFSGAKIKKTGIKNKSVVKKGIKIAAGLLIAVVLIKSGKLHDIINKAKPDYSLQKIEKAAEELSTNFKFEKADLVNDVNKIMRGQKLPPESVNLYMTTVSDPNAKVYMSENAGQMMDVLALAANSPSNKDQITSDMLKRNIIKALQHDEKLLAEGDTITGDGEPWYYIAAALLDKNNPKFVDYMPQAEKEYLQSRGFFKSFADDIMISVGKKEPPKQYIGNILEKKDYEYMIDILSNRGDLLSLPSDNKWFGPAAVGYAIRGKLDCIKGMTPEGCENFIKDYIQNPSNHQRFATDTLYREKVISSYIYFNLNEAIEHNSGKVNSGLSALAMQEARLLADKTGETLLNQVKEEVPQFHLFNNETKKLDVAIKTMVLARNNQYFLLNPETRFAMRKFEVDHPTSTATATFKLAEDYYQIQLSKEAKNHEVLQMNVYLETTRPSEKINPKSIKKASQDLINYNSDILVKIKNEIEVEKLADPIGDRIKILKKMNNDLSNQNEQLKSIITQIDKPKAPEKVQPKEPSILDEAKKFVDEQVDDFIEKTNELGKDITDFTARASKVIKDINNFTEGAGELMEKGKSLTNN
ncbi:MAG: hypothetical protein PHC34_00020 [Candidatus Gastranaerophilales bacterium]|nr:hypothetical protein [Candidatus Gastranaerophilales bacterium]